MVTPQCETGSDVGNGLKLLLSFNPNPDQKDLKGKTPLILAVEAEKESAVRSLVSGTANKGMQTIPLFMCLYRSILVSLDVANY